MLLQDPLCLLVLVAALSSCASTAASGDNAEPIRDTGWTTIGQSAEGRDVRARTLGSGSDGSGVKRVAVIAGIHGDEQEGLRHIDEIVRWVDAWPTEVRLYEDINPDGTAAGTRHTSNGVDPNRNWPASNFAPAPERGPRPLSEPAIAAAHADLVAFDPELVVVLHSARRGPFVNYDGPAAAYAERFAEAATATGGTPWRVVPDMGYATPGSFGTWMGKDRQIPTLTVELRRGSLPSDTEPALRAGFASLFARGPILGDAGSGGPDGFRVR